VGPSQVQRLLDLAQDERAFDRRWVGQARARLARAQMELDQTVDRFIALGSAHESLIGRPAVAQP